MLVAYAIIFSDIVFLKTKGSFYAALIKTSYSFWIKVTSISL